LLGATSGDPRKMQFCQACKIITSSVDDHQHHFVPLVAPSLPPPDRQPSEASAILEIAQHMMIGWLARDSAETVHSYSGAATSRE
jgi:hypothetical protein